MFRNFVVIVLIAVLLYGGSTKAQLVNSSFDNLDVAENFENNSNNWTIVSGSDNLFLIQGGEYLLNRKSTASPYAIISGIPLPGDAFKLVTSLNLQKTVDNKGSIGLLFALQGDRRGGYLLEFNKSAQYRIRQISGSDYLYITGNEKNMGWEKFDAIFSMGTPNIVELRTADKNFDLYINSRFVKSITNQNYTFGSFGFVMGPGSKGSIDFVHIYVANDNPVAKTKGDDADVAALAQSVITLKTEVNKLKEENDMLRKTINAVKSETKSNDGEKKLLKEQLKELQSSYNILSAKNDSLVKANEELKKYKELIEANSSGDIVINLSKTLKAEKEKSTALQQANKKLQDELNEMRKQSNEQKKSDDFILPK